jgi:hypothetical protein
LSRWPKPGLLPETNDALNGSASSKIIHGSISVIMNKVVNGSVILIAEVRFSFLLRAGNGRVAFTSPDRFTRYGKLLILLKSQIKRMKNQLMSRL